ncbi:glycosyltransferase [Spongiactinospora sp. 9N601]
MRQIDVSVVVPVRDRRPHLDRCLTSLLVQRVAVEIVAVDDGSADGGGELLDLYAAHHPGVVKVLRLDRPMGAGRARNLGLANAHGRYVFFCDADDHLGPGTLERMIAMADRNGSDIVLGRGAGPGPVMFEADTDRAPLGDSPVYNSLSCCKLFRREMLTAHDITFAEDLRVGEDIVFTSHAYCHAGVISVVAGHDCHHPSTGVAQKNGDRDPVHWLRMIRRPMELVAGHVPPGPLRDHLMRRHFRHDALAHLGAPFLAAGDVARKEIAAEIAALCERWLTDGVRERLSAPERRKLAALDDIDQLVRLARVEASAVTRRLTEVAWAGDLLTLRGEAALDGGPDLDFTVSVLLRPRGPAAHGERSFPVWSGGGRFAGVIDLRDVPSGVWNVHVAITCEGVTRLGRLRPERTDAAPGPRLLGDRAAVPYFTRVQGNLSIDLGGHVAAVPCAAKITEAGWGRGNRLLLGGRVTVGGAAPGSGTVRRLVWRERRSGHERGRAVTDLPGGGFAVSQGWEGFAGGVWDAFLELDLGGPPVRCRIDAGAPVPPHAWWRWAVRRTVRPYSTSGRGRLSVAVRNVPVRRAVRRLLG